MGMSASQARLLSLTTRLSDLELRAQTISNSKTRLADASSEASRNYQEALDKQRLTMYNSASDSRVDATAKNLTTYNSSTLGKQRILVDAAGQVIISQQMADAYNAAIDNQGNVNFQTFLNSITGADGKGFTEISSGSIRTNQVNELLGTLSTALSTVMSNIDGDYLDEDAVLSYKDASLVRNSLQAVQNALNAIGQVFDGEDLNGTLSDCSVQSLIGTNPSARTVYNKISTILVDEVATNITDADIDSTTATGGDLQDAMDANDEFTYDYGAITYYANVFNQISENGPSIVSSENMNDSDWLYEQLKCGNIFLVEQGEEDKNNDGENDWSRISWQSGDSSLSLESDETQLAKVEAEYNTALDEIKAKDSRYDVELKSIDTEHSVVQNQIDSTKKVIEKNIDRSFKIFNA